MSDDASKKIFGKGETIINQGEVGKSAYIIEKGRVEIFIEKSDGSITSVGTRGEGSMIGEMAIVDQAPRTATIKALEKCHLLEITEEDFARRLRNADPILRMTTQVILTRYRDMLTREDIGGGGGSGGGDETAVVLPAELQELSYAQDTDAILSVKIANDFKQALGSEQIFLNYQPIVSLEEDGKVLGFEALMRWVHPEKGFIPPDVFIPVIEDSGLIIEASQWVLREACKALKRIESKTGYKDELFMSVNFTARDFSSDGFVDDVYNVISETDVRPEQLHIEITERLLMRQPDSAKKTLQRCADAGMNISIDDFGTGYSSLSYLHYFPISTLKIDRCFVMNMLKDSGSMELIKSIVGLSKNMGMEIIAEGVEDADEAAALKDLGCEMAQGYHFAKPMSEQDVAEFVSAAKKR